MKEIGVMQMELIEGGAPCSLAESLLAQVGCAGVSLMFGIAAGPIGGFLASVGCGAAVDYLCRQRAHS